MNRYTVTCLLLVTIPCGGKKACPSAPPSLDHSSRHFNSIHSSFTREMQLSEGPYYGAQKNANRPNFEDQAIMRHWSDKVNLMNNHLQKVSIGTYIYNDTPTEANSSHSKIMLRSRALHTCINTPVQQPYTYTTIHVLCARMYHYVLSKYTYVHVHVLV